MCIKKMRFAFFSVANFGTICNKHGWSQLKSTSIDPYWAKKKKVNTWGKKYHFKSAEEKQKSF